MSLPLTRRIARIALLVAAGAAPVVGAAGSASAAGLPATPDLGGLSTLDSAHTSTAVDGAAHQVAGLASDSGSKTLKKAAPAGGDAVGTGVRTAAPVAEQAVGQLPVGQLPLG